MRVLAAFGLLALMPAALNAGVPAQRGITMRICSGSAEERMVRVPLFPSEPLDGGDKTCWHMGCHAASSRKKFTCHI